MFEIFLWSIAIALGTAILVKGADLLVDSGGSVARYFGVPVIIVGLTLVAFGTSLPELAASLNAVLIQKSGISLGNIIGSNIANILLVLGATSFISPIELDGDIFKREIPIMFLVFGAFLIVLYFGKKVVFYEGIFLLAIFLAYLFVFSKIALKEEGKTNLKKEMEDEKYVEINNIDLKFEFTKIFIGLIGVILGSQLLIKGSVFYMKTFNLTQGFVGLSIVAISTSLPEMAASAVAAKKSESDISLGNIIGSNIFNILLVIGICSLIISLTVSKEIMINSIVMVFVGGILTFFMYSGNRISRLEGMGMLITYFIFLYGIYSFF